MSIDRGDISKENLIFKMIRNDKRTEIEFILGWKYVAPLCSSWNSDCHGNNRWTICYSDRTCVHLKETGFFFP
jgi:hypothetical protein